MVVRCVRAEAAAASRLAGHSEYVGLLRGHLETDLSFKVDGTIELIGPDTNSPDWHEGTRIYKTNLLARLNQKNFTAAVADAKAKQVLYAGILRRTKELLESRMVSQQELDLAVANFNSANATLDRANEALAESTIYPPYDGVIVARLANAGETVMAMASRPVLRVADQTRMAIDLGVPDKLIGRITNHLRVPVRVSSLEGLSLTGEVTEVGVAAKPGTRLFKVVTELTNHCDLASPQTNFLKSGMSAMVDFSAAESLPTNAVVVPLSALVASTGTNGPQELAVFVVADGHARQRRVETGEIIRSSIVITTNLHPGELVVTAGASTLVDGMAVDARPEEEL